MLKPKQVAYLRSLSNHIKPVAQIGKDGLSDNLLDTILNYLNKHELMKVSILQNSFVSDEEVKEYGLEAGEMGDGDQRLQTSSYKMNKF